MNDLDKRLNLDMDSGGGTLEPYGKHNVNLRTTGQSEEVGSCGVAGGQHGATGNHHTSWLLHATFPGRTGTNKTASVPGSPSRSGIPSRCWTSSKSSYITTTASATSRYLNYAVPKTDFRSSLHATLTKDSASAYTAVEIDKCEKLLGPLVSSSSSSPSSSSSSSPRFPILGIVRRWPPVSATSGSYTPSAAATRFSQRYAANIRNQPSLRSHRCTSRPQNTHNAFAASYDFFCTFHFLPALILRPYIVFNLSQSSFIKSRSRNHYVVTNHLNTKFFNHLRLLLCSMLASSSILSHVN